MNGMKKLILVILTNSIFFISGHLRNHHRSGLGRQGQERHEVIIPTIHLPPQLDVFSLNISMSN